MKERPILFSGEMVRAILEDRKTQTRRPMKCQLPKDDGGTATCISGRTMHQELVHQAIENNPFGQPGDRLWVRETWGIVPILDCNSDRVAYRSDYSQACGEDQVIAPVPKRWRPSIHMPRWASRLTLEITAVRVERLQDISEEDAKAEGCNGDCPIGYIPAYEKAPLAYHFAQVWDACYGTESWSANPWVWVIEFRRVKP